MLFPGHISGVDRVLNQAKRYTVVKQKTACVLAIDSLDVNQSIYSANCAT